MKTQPLHLPVPGFQFQHDKLRFPTVVAGWRTLLLQIVSFPVSLPLVFPSTCISCIHLSHEPFAKGESKIDRSCISFAESQSYCLWKKEEHSFFPFLTHFLWQISHKYRNTFINKSFQAMQLAICLGACRTFVYSFRRFMNSGGLAVWDQRNLRYEQVVLSTISANRQWVVGRALKTTLPRQSASGLCNSSSLTAASSPELCLAYKAIQSLFHTSNLRSIAETSYFMLILFLCPTTHPFLIFSQLMLLPVPGMFFLPNINLNHSLKSVDTSYICPLIHIEYSIHSHFIGRVRNLKCKSAIYQLDMEQSAYPFWPNFFIY